MNGQIDWRDLFTSAQGRLARTPFLVAAAIIVALAAFYEVWVPATLHWLTGWFIYPALLFGGACVLSKRLHDRGRSGWWAALVLFALVAVWPAPHGVASFLFCLILAWAAVELGVMTGEQGANRFGPSPLGAAIA